VLENVVLKSVISQFKNTSERFHYFNKKMRTTHAEMNLIVSYLKENDINPLTIKSDELKKIDFPKHIQVLSPYGNRVRISKPCSDCLDIIKLCGITHVTYSTNDRVNPFVTENVNDINSKQSSNRTERRELGLL